MTVDAFQRAVNELRELHRLPIAFGLVERGWRDGRRESRWAVIARIGETERQREIDPAKLASVPDADAVRVASETVSLLFADALGPAAAVIG